MNFQFYIEKLNSSEAFKKFKDENPKAFLCSGFFTFEMSKKTDNDKKQFDFLVEDSNKIFSFDLEGEIKTSVMDVLEGQKFAKLKTDYDFDFSDMEGLIREAMKENEVKNDLQKILYSLQEVDGKVYLVGTVFVSGFGMLQVNIDVDKKKVNKFEKKNFLDILKVTRGKK